MKKYISILGSTGSIGQSTLKVARHLTSEKISVVAIAANSNIDLLEKQAKEFHPKLIGVFNEKAAKELQMRLPHIPVIAGLEGLIAAATIEGANLVVSAISGTLGLIPTVSAIKAKKNIALANKEALVSGGSLVISLAKKNGVSIIPVDSEHSAIFQCLNGEKIKSVNRIILTASGGPFRDYTTENQFNEIKITDALNHPNWSMGQKVTLDCSTLMNKGLEVIEAYWLFGLPLDKIEVIIHPQSIIHSLVEYVDGSMIAQMSQPTMVVPIQYALTYPQRYNGLIEKFDFLKYNSLEFYKPKTERFRCLQLAYDCIREGGSLPCYMNAANEILVEKFIQGKIRWIDISHQLEELLSKHSKQTISDIEDVLNVDTLARKEAAAYTHR